MSDIIDLEDYKGQQTLEKFWLLDDEDREAVVQYVRGLLEQERDKLRGEALNWQTDLYILRSTGIAYTGESEARAYFEREAERLGLTEEFKDSGIL